MGGGSAVMRPFAGVGWWVVGCYIVGFGFSFWRLEELVE